MCRFDHATTAFYLIENDMQSTLAMRADMMQKLRNMVGELINQ